MKNGFQNGGFVRQTFQIKSISFTVFVDCSNAVKKSNSVDLINSANPMNFVGVSDSDYHSLATM